MQLPTWVRRASPLAERLATYDRETLFNDLIGGSVVAVMLVPQAMAYAMLAGLPPQVGLYASILPLILYALFGSSNVLAVGPVAMVSLLVASGVGTMATPGSAEYLSLCLTLAAMVGVIQILMAMLKFGFLLNFISHPVIRGFTSAAAIVIAFSQLKYLLGIEVPQTELPYQTIVATLRSLPTIEWATFAIGLTSCGLLLAGSFALTPLLNRLGLSRFWAGILPRFTPLIVVALGVAAISLFHWDTNRGVNIVGEIPSGLPRLTMPDFSIDTLIKLGPLALVIGLVGFLESYSVAKALAGRRREKVHPNREMVALGIADLGASITGGFPVTGGFSRSVVAENAGIRTPMGSIITAIIVAVSVLLLPEYFHHIPRAVLAAIILVAVISLIDFRVPLGLWKFSRPDALAWLVTFLAVLFLGIENGILAGIIATAMLLMWRVSRPFVTKVGRIAGSEHFRNVDRFKVETHPDVIAFRVDASLIFANAPFVEDYVLGLVADHPDVKSLLLIATGVNDIDATGIELFNSLRLELHDAGVGFYLSDVKGPVTDRLREAGFDETFMNCNLFLNADEAMKKLTSP